MSTTADMKTVANNIIPSKNDKPKFVIRTNYLDSNIPLGVSLSKNRIWVRQTEWIVYEH